MDKSPNNLAENDPARLVQELTEKLEQLRAVERGYEGGEPAFSATLQAQLAALLQPANSGSSSSSLPSSPVQPGAVSLSTSPAFSTVLHTDPASDHLSQALVAALERERALQRENARLRTANQRAERWRGELYELRKHLGISVEELEGLSSDHTPGRHRQRSRDSLMSSSSSPPSSVFGFHNRRRSGDASVSSYSTSANSRSRYGGSVSTTLTTPSSSYPATRAPLPTPATSPLSGRLPFSSRSFGTAFHDRNSTLDFDDLAPSPPPEAQDLDSGQATPLSISPGSRSGSLSRRPSNVSGRGNVNGRSAPSVPVAGETRL